VSLVSNSLANWKIEQNSTDFATHSSLSGTISPSYKSLISHRHLFVGEALPFDTNKNQLQLVKYT